MRAAKRNYNCPTQKIDYESKAKCMQHASRASKPLYPYKCTYCHGWHLTSTEIHERPEAFFQTLYHNYTITHENGFWSSPEIPNRWFKDIKEIKTYIDGLLKSCPRASIS